MSRLLITRLLGPLLFALFAPRAAAIGPDPVWTVAGFAQPESAVFAADKNVIYVSNVNGDPLAKDGNGFISKVSADGKLLQREWLRGLHAPKGLAYRAGLLYIVDVDALLIVDTSNRKVLSRFPVRDAKFLNDVALDGGRAYVSDMVGNTIYRQIGNGFGPLLTGPALRNPNGLVVDGGRLIVGSWGEMTGTGFETRSDGYLLSASLDGKTIEPRFAPIPFANIDGVVLDGRGGYIVSDWVHGNVYKVSAQGESRLWLLLEQGSADIAMGPKRQILVPMMLNNELRAYALD